ncbi:hypothetical protein BC332_20456 [Capsicum chinense]|nr:hypothetical protein BC332_20456 [Capsicum chinense]
MTLPCCMRKQPKAILDVSQYTMNPSEPSGRAKLELRLTVGIDKDIIYEDYDEHVQVLLEHMVHQVHEIINSVGKTNGHDKEFKVSILSTESSFQNVTFSDLELMIA